MLKKIIELFSKNSTIQTNITCKGNVVGSNIIVDGQIVNTMKPGINYEIHVFGDVKEIDTQGRVTVQGNVEKVDAQGRVTVEGDVYGNINTMGRVEVGGSVNGDIDTMGSVRTGK
jgi:cytoskeletal protein CcmA (bactofilin family)